MFEGTLPTLVSPSVSKEAYLALLWNRCFLRVRNGMWHF